jgi:hypothetical protein
MHLIDLAFKVSDEAVVLVEEPPVGHNNMMLHPKQATHEGLCAMQLSPGLHQCVRDVATHVAQSAEISGGNGSTLSIPTQIESIGTNVSGGQHGPGMGRGGIPGGDAEGEHPCTNSVVCSTHKPEVFEGCHLGGVTLKGITPKVALTASTA